ncbi:MAG: hypothetical protein ACE5DI_06305 [Candidatus Micrarchaeia archaeon]
MAERFVDSFRGFLKNTHRFRLSRQIATGQKEALLIHHSERKSFKKSLEALKGTDIGKLADVGFVVKKTGGVASVTFHGLQLGSKSDNKRLIGVVGGLKKSFEKIGKGYCAGVSVTPPYAIGEIGAGSRNLKSFLEHLPKFDEKKDLLHVVTLHFSMPENAPVLTELDRLSRSWLVRTRKIKPKKFTHFYVE